MTTNATLTARQHEGLFWIARKGGGLAGGRENTRTTDQLIAKGLIARKGRDVAVTFEGLRFLVANPFTAEWMTAEASAECQAEFQATLITAGAVTA